MLPLPRCPTLPSPLSPSYPLPPRALPDPDPSPYEPGQQRDQPLGDRDAPLHVVRIGIAHRRRNLDCSDSLDRVTRPAPSAMLRQALLAARVASSRSLLSLILASFTAIKSSTAT